MTSRVEELETPAVHRWQRYGWLLQVVGWLTMAALVTLSILGIVAEGPLGRVELEDSGDSRISFSRFVQRGSSTTVELEVPVEPGTETVEVALDDSWLSSMRVQHITPAPDAVRVTDDGYRYEFAVATGPRVEIAFQLAVDEVGRLRGDLQVEDHTPVDIRQFAYP